MEKGCRCDAGFERGWKGVSFCCWNGGVFCVGCGAEPDYFVSDFEVVQVSGACCDDSAFCFTAKDFGFGGGVESAAVISANCQRLLVRVWEGEMGAYVSM